MYIPMRGPVRSSRMLREERTAGVEEGRRVRKITQNVLQSRGRTCSEEKNNKQLLNELQPFSDPDHP